MAALRQAIVVDELGISLFSPTLRCRVNLVGKNAHGGWYLNALWCKEWELAFPIQSSRGDGRICQPVQGDVVENVLPSEPLRLTVEYASDERETACVVIEHPRSQARRRIRDSVQCLRPIGHFLRISETMLVENVELIPSSLLIDREARWLRVAQL